MSPFKAGISLLLIITAASPIKINPQKPHTTQISIELTTSTFRSKSNINIAITASVPMLNLKLYGYCVGSNMDINVGI